MLHLASPRGRPALVPLLAALALLLSACGGTTPGGGGPGGTPTPADPEEAGRFSITVDGRTYGSGSQDSYGASALLRSTSEFILVLYSDLSASADATYLVYGRDASGSEEISVIEFGADGSTEIFEGSVVSDALVTNVGSAAYGVGIGTTTGSLSATVRSGSGATTTVSVSGLDVVLYDYAGYVPPN